MSYAILGIILWGINVVIKHIPTSNVARLVQAIKITHPHSKIYNIILGMDNRVMPSILIDLSDFCS